MVGVLVGLVGGFCWYKKMKTAKEEEDPEEEVQEKDVEVEDEV